jgi:hypothetical protein
MKKLVAICMVTSFDKKNLKNRQYYNLVSSTLLTAKAVN